jgi:hypothetical protein
MKGLLAAASAALAAAALPGLASAQTTASTGVYANLGYADVHRIWAPSAGAWAASATGSAWKARWPAA